MSGDVVNAALLCVAALLQLLNVRAAYRAKRVIEAHWGPTAFFGGLGLWEFFFLGSLGQPFSAVLNLILASTNSAWLVLYWRYRGNA